MTQPSNSKRPQPIDPAVPPDPARTYERAKPEAESGMGRLTCDPSTPTDVPDQEDQAVGNRQDSRQLNTEQVQNDRKSEDPNAPEQGEQASHPGENPDQAARAQPDHSMHEEEPLGEDTMPTDIRDKRQRRHPRTEGRGGLP